MEIELNKKGDYEHKNSDVHPEKMKRKYKTLGVPIITVLKQNSQ